jgi:hypothetical protein
VIWFDSDSAIIVRMEIEIAERLKDQEDQNDLK